MEQTQVKPEPSAAPQLKPPGKKRRWLRPVIALAVAAAIVVLVLSRCVAGGQAMIGQAYLPAAAQRQELTVSVSGTGTIRPVEACNVAAAVKGEVLEAPFAAGDTVKKGDVLFRIDAGTLNTSIEQQEISLEQARLNLENLLNSQEDARKNQQVKASATGVITTLYVDQGDMVSAGAPIADILDREHMELTLPFHSEDAAAFFPGQAAEVYVDGTDEMVAAAVDSIAAADGVGAGGTLVREVTLRLTNPGVLTDSSTGTAAVNGAVCAAGGTFAYGESRQVSARTSGELVSLTVKEGDRVVDGQLIAAFDDTDMENQVEAARLSIRSAELALQSARDSLEDYTITAPIDGVVVEMNYEAGDELDPTAGYLAVIYDMSALEFVMDVHELDISRVAVGQQVEITASALDGQTFAGRVDAININGSTLNGITNYPVTVKVEGGGALLPGMNVSARVIAQRVGDVLCIPVEAVEEGGTVLVAGAGALSEDGLTVADVTKLSRVQVALGNTDGTYIEVCSGLSEGDVVVYAVQQSSLIDTVLAARGG